MIKMISKNIISNSLSDLKKNMDAVSDQIRSSEKEFWKADINISFEKKIEEEKDGTKKSYWLSWEKDEQSKERRFRLFLIEKEGKKLEIISKKPLIETTFETRFRVVDHIPTFIDEFIKYVKEKLIYVEDK